MQSQFEIQSDIDLKSEELVDEEENKKESSKIYNAQSLQISSNQLTNPLIKIIILHNVLFPLFFSIIKTWQKYKNNKILSIYKISLVMPLINNYKPYIWLNKLQHIHFRNNSLLYNNHHNLFCIA